MNYKGEIKFMASFFSIKGKLENAKYINAFRLIRKYFKTIYYRTFSDKKFLNKKFKEVFGREISKNNPRSFNEKLQWLKLYWYDPIAEICVDKYLVREYLEKLGLGHLLNDLIDVYDRVEDIKFEKLPEKFVLKCTHGSKCNIICKNKHDLDWKTAKKKLSNWMSTNYYWFSREWVYKKIKPRIVCEKFLEDDFFGELVDYKFFCFNGIPLYIMVGTERFSNTGLKVDYYDTQWNHLEIKQDDPFSGKDISKPQNLESMIKYAKQLSSKFSFVRIDFYEANMKLYFGEFTFFPSGGFEKFQPEKYDFDLGNELKLPDCNK